MLKKKFRSLGSIVMMLVLATAVMPAVAQAEEHVCEVHTFAATANEATCPYGHSLLYDGEAVVITPANSEYHWIEICDSFYCADCDLNYLTLLETRYELHDLSGVAPSPNRFECVICGYTE